MGFARYNGGQPIRPDVIAEKADEGNAKPSSMFSGILVKV
jgi:hypothetical protein